MTTQIDTAPVGALRRALRSRSFVVGGALVLGVALLAVLAAPLTWLTGNDPNEQFTELLGPSSVPTGPLGGVSPQHWFGLTPLGGRDLFAIVSHGAQVSLGIGLASTALSLGIGTVVGLAAGYFGGWADRLLSRAADVLFGFPFLIFAIALSAIVPAEFPRPLLLILVLGFFGWPGAARLVRGEVLSLRGRGYVVAARTMGAGSGHVLFRQLLPAVAPMLIVSTTLSIPGRIGAEAALSFLGVGINPPTPSWGRSISDAIAWIQVDPMYLVFPGLVLFLVTLGFNLLGDALRDLLDPRLRVRA